jgi:hypothetical protein
MRFGLFHNFGAKNSQPVFDSFRKGLNALGFFHESHDMTADVAVIWSVLWSGTMRHNRDVWSHFRQQNKPVIVIEVGMLQRGHTWKMGVNGTGSYAYHGQGLDLSRPTKLGLSLQPWRSTGDRIVVCAQRTESLQWQNQPCAEQWLSDVRNRLRLYTQRPLVLRTHPRQKITPPSGYILESPRPVTGTYDDFDFAKSLSDTWAVINHNSGPGCQAVISGVPAFVDASSLAASVGNLDLSQIESPVMPDRGSWFIRLCHTEWTVQEIATGWPIQRLLPGLQAI